MSTIQGTTELRPIYSVLYTHDTRNSGHIRSLHWRFSDTLNHLDQDFVQLHDAAIQPLYGTREDETFVASAFLRRDNMIIGLPVESQAGVERIPLRQGQRVDRQTIKVILEAWPFTIRGTLHLPVGSDLMTYIHAGRQQPFMPVTTAFVTYHLNQMLNFEAPFVVVNRHRIESILDASLIGVPEEVDRDVVQPKVVDAPPEPKRVATLLAEAGLFDSVDERELEQICSALCERGLIGRKVCLAKGEIFHQGDLGDTLYLVESGLLEVFIAEPGQPAFHTLANFSHGDFFGEMAILGDGRRTATVNAITNSIQVSLHKEAVSNLLTRFPSAKAKIDEIMAERRLALDDAMRERKPLSRQNERNQIERKRFWI